MRQPFLQSIEIISFKQCCMQIDKWNVYSTYFFSEYWIKFTSLNIGAIVII